MACTIAAIWIAICLTTASAEVHALGQQRSAYECRIDNIPTSWRLENAPGTIDAHHVHFGESGEASIDLRFHNNEPISLQSIALVVQYLGSGSEVIDRVPIVASAKPTVVKQPSRVLSPANTWQSALAPGDSALLTALSDGIRTGSCPFRAEVTFARVQFADGTDRNFSSPGWRLGPVPVTIPAMPISADELPVEPPASLLAKLKISAMGDVVDVVPDDSADPKLVDWIGARMKGKWKFHPALLNGKPTESQLSVLFLIYAKGMTGFPDLKPVARPVTLIRFVWRHNLSPQAGTDDQLTVMYGSLLEGSRPSFPFEKFVSSN